MSLASGFFPADFKMPVAKHGDTGFSQETSLKTLVMGSVREPNYRLTIILPPLVIEVTTQYIHIYICIYSHPANSRLQEVILHVDLNVPQ